MRAIEFFYERYLLVRSVKICRSKEPGLPKPSLHVIQPLSNLSEPNNDINDPSALPKSLSVQYLESLTFLTLVQFAMTKNPCVYLKIGDIMVCTSLQCSTALYVLMLTGGRSGVVGAG